MITTSQYFDDLVLAALTQHIASGGVNGPLYNCTLMLFSNNLQLTPANTFGDLVEATYSGYARQTGIVWSAPILQTDGTYTIISNLYTWLAQAQSNFTPQVVFGWALIDTATPPNLLMAEKFPVPQAFSVPNDGFGMTMSFNFGQLNQFSFATIIA